MHGQTKKTQTRSRTNCLLSTANYLLMTNKLGPKINRKITFKIQHLTLYLPVSSIDNLYKQFGPRSGPTKCQARSESKLFDTLMVFLKEFFEKLILKKISR